MPRIPAITAYTDATSPHGVSTPPGQSHGLVPLVREEAGMYAGPLVSQGTDQEELIVGEKLASGPRDVVFPWFLPYHDTGALQESAVMRLAYRQMLKSPVVKSALLGKIFGVARLDLKMQPADKNNAKDRAVAQHMHWMLTQRLLGGMPMLAWNVIVHGCIDGYSVSEKVTCLEERGRYEGKYSLAKLKPKDTNNDIVLQTDEYRNVIGMLGLRYNGGREFSPANFVIYRHLPLFDSPTGMSDLAAAYYPYWMLDTVTKLRAISAERYAIPFLVGKYLNTTVKTALEKSLKQAKSQRWLSIPEATQVEAISMAGSSEDQFRSFRNDLLHDIFLGIQYAVLQALEGDTTDGRGDSQVHESTSEKALWFLARSLENVLNDQETGIIKDYVDLNHVVSEYPQASIAAVDVNEQQQQLGIAVGLSGLGLPLSKNEMYERFDFQPPEDESDALAAPAPPSTPSAPSGAGQELPFDDGLDVPPVEGEAQPFRRFGEQWAGYLAAAS